MTVDPGLQPERTALSWRRTALAICAVGLGAARLLGDEIGPAALVLAIACLAGGGILWVTSDRRYARVTRSLARGRGTATGGALMLATAVGVSAIGAAALLAVLLTVGSGLGRG